MDLKDNSAIPVTDEQVKAFAIWVKDRYGGREEFGIALQNKNRAIIAYYFVHHIFSEEMASVYNKSEPYVDTIGESPPVKLLQLYRRRLDIKISRTGAELIKRAFPKVEDNEPVSESLQLQRNTTQLRMEHYWQFVGRIPRCKVIHRPTATEIGSFIPSVCVLCLTTHTMLDVCITNCGHEFGSKCLEKWDFKTCPTCSDFCSEVTEFV